MSNKNAAIWLEQKVACNFDTVKRDSKNNIYETQKEVWELRRNYFPNNFEKLHTEYGNGGDSGMFITPACFSERGVMSTTLVGSVANVTFFSVLL